MNINIQLDFRNLVEAVQENNVNKLKNYINYEGL